MNYPTKVKSNTAAILLTSLLLMGVFATTGCRVATTDEKSIVVTYSILGSIVRELAGDSATVTVLVPDGVDPHEWEPSARDIEKVNNAALVVRNGLGLEEGLEAALDRAESRGVKMFTAANHIEIRYVGPGEGIPGGAPDQQIGAPDPHMWVDPIAMKKVVAALALELKSTLGIDAAARALSLESRLDELNTGLVALTATVPLADRKLVTGHESMGYFARRYGFQLIGAVIPNLSTQAEISAADMAALIELVRENQVKAIFTETGTSASAVQQVAAATGARIVEISPVQLPPNGSYFTFMQNLSNTIVEALK